MPRALISLTHSLFLSLSLAIRLYRPSLPSGLLDNILCLYRAVVDKFFLIVQHLHVLGKGSTGERGLWFHPYFLACLVRLIWMVFERGGRWLDMILLFLMEHNKIKRVLVWYYLSPNSTVLKLCSKKIVQLYRVQFKSTVRSTRSWTF